MDIIKRIKDFSIENVILPSDTFLGEIKYLAEPPQSVKIDKALRPSVLEVKGINKSEHNTLNLECGDIVLNVTEGVKPLFGFVTEGKDYIVYRTGVVEFAVKTKDFDFNQVSFQDYLNSEKPEKKSKSNIILPK